MQTTVSALLNLEEPAQRRVLAWVSDALGVEKFTVAATASTAERPIGVTHTPTEEGEL